ncbi:glycosyl hydrolase family 65 protein, partial [Arcticibacter sp.]|uniref:glycosyl hydrolase family 65 protein n=1 Tax=Arcticibacter sp. TaxID=1872630 RepID=UPI00388E24F4
GEIYLGEYQDEKTGYWLKGDNPRSRFYNHSGYCDLIINDLVGLKPSDDNTLHIQPLVPQNQWDWFCLDNVLYHGKIITVLWDKTGEKYGKGKGFRVFADGKQVMYSAKLKEVKAKL